jgi:hypothetical protein
LSDQAFAFALAVNVGGVEKVDARVERQREEVHEFRRFALKDPADAGASQTKLGRHEIGSAKTAAGNP